MASKKLWQRQATAATAWETLHRKFHSGGGDGGKEKRNRESGGGGGIERWRRRRRRGRRQREEGEDGRNCDRRGLCNSGQCELQQWRRRRQAEVQVR